MGQKGYEVLDFMIRNYKEMLDCVVSFEDESTQEDFYNEIREKCINSQIPFFNKNDEYQVNSKYIFAISWRWLLFSENVNIIIFHDSLLPRYRGFNPLVSYLLNKEKKIGVSALFAAEKFDAGDIIGQSSVDIQYPIKLQEAIKKISVCYVKLVDNISSKIKNEENIVGTPQDESEVSYSLWRDELDYRIDWAMASDYIKRQVDALGFPYKGASSILNNKLVRILEAEISDDIKIENRHPGKVIFKEDDNPVVVCGRGLIKIKSIEDNETGLQLLPLRKFRTRFK